MMNEIILVTRNKLDKIKTLFDSIDDDKNGKPINQNQSNPV